MSNSGFRPDYRGKGRENTLSQPLPHPGESALIRTQAPAPVSWHSAASRFSVAVSHLLAFLPLFRPRRLQRNHPVCPDRPHRQDRLASEFWSTPSTTTHRDGYFWFGTQEGLALASTGSVTSKSSTPSTTKASKTTTSRILPLLATAASGSAPAAALPATKMASSRPISPQPHPSTP